MNAHHAVDEVIVRDAEAPVDLGLEAARGRVVAYFDGGVGRSLRRNDGSVLQGSWIFPPP